MQNSKKRLRGELFYYFCILFFSLGLFITNKAKAAETQNKVQLLSRLANINNWTVKQEKGVLNIFQGKYQNKKYLGLFFDCTSGNKGEILLKNPITIPNWATGFTFLGCKNYPLNTQSNIDLLIKDKNNNEFRFYTSSSGSGSQGLYWGSHWTNNGWKSLGQVRFTTPGLKNPLPSFWTPLTPDTVPSPPYRLLGFYLEGAYQWKYYPGATMYFSDFAFTHLTLQGSSFYYHFNGTSHYGELDPVPYITLGDLQQQNNLFRISWDVRNNYAGKPIMAGGKTFILPSSSSTNTHQDPYLLGLNQKIRFPMFAPGTYWVRIKLRSFQDTTSKVPDLILEKKFRLFIPDYKKPYGTFFPMISDTQKIPDTYVRIGTLSKNGSYIYNHTEKFIVPVIFFKPPDYVNKFKVEVMTYYSKKVLKKFKVNPIWNGTKPYICNINLTDLPDGIYRIEAQENAGTKIFDKAEQLIAHKSPKLSAIAPSISKNVITYQDILSSETPLFQITPLVDFTTNGKTRWKELKKAMNWPLPSKEIECEIPWSMIEPLPGVYNFSEPDKILTYAKKKGYKVSLWLTPDFPEWIPSIFIENSKKEFSPSWIESVFHGGQPNLPSAPIKTYFISAVKHLVEYCADRSSLESYFFCLEGFGEDEPWINWYPGYEKGTQKQWKQYCKKHWGSLNKINARWETHFTDWNQLGVPPKNSSYQYNLDWINFKMLRIDALYKSIVRTIRSIDKKRLIILYGVWDPNTIVWMKNHGCMDANGGSLYVAEECPLFMENQDLGIQERTESISTVQWEAPGQTFSLDDSVFDMTLGGGGSTHCREYIPTDGIKTLNALKKPPYGLDRYEKFMPIWTDLRRTKPVSNAISYFGDYTGYFAKDKTYFGWGGGYDTQAVTDMVQSHLLAHYSFMTFLSGKLFPQQKRAKIIFLINTELNPMKQSTIDNLVQYVKKGGTIVMLVKSGRRSVKYNKTKDWVLLKDFGFSPPKGEINTGYTIADTAKGKVFPASKPFVLQGQWNTPFQKDAENIAYFNNDKQPAITFKRFGKGKVFVIWADSIIPPSQAVGKISQSYPFLRELAKFAGAKMWVDSNTPYFWLNLLKKEHQKLYYGLVYYHPWSTSPSSVTGAVKFNLPDGNYNITELITEKKLGTMSSTDLETQGIPTTLVPHQVAIYKIQKQ